MWYNDLNSPLQSVEDETLVKAGVMLWIKRDDLIHPQISGNKWRKLKHNIAAAKKQHLETILTFGGAFSNHIAATAAAGQEFNIKTIGIIRGEATTPLNPTLSFATACGMEIHYLDRTSYRKKETASLIKDLKNKFEAFWLIPEGGCNNEGAKGCEEIVSEIDINFEYICCPCGTATTISGISQALQSHQKVLGFPALKGGAYLNDTIQALSTKENYLLFNDYHFGGYAKYKPQLIDFITHFKKTHGIQLDPIYTGKMMYGLYDLIAKGYFKKGTKIIAVHTGGLQGIDGFNKRYKTNL